MACPAGKTSAGGAVTTCDWACAENEKVESDACVACPAGKTSAGGAVTECDTSFVLVGSTECSTLATGVSCFCESFVYSPIDNWQDCKQYLQDESIGGLFKGENGGYDHATVSPYCTTRASGSDMWFNSDFDSPTECKQTSSHVCICIDTGFCAANEHVSNGTCTACPVSSTNAGGDDPAGEDTTCDFACAEGEFVGGITVTLLEESSFCKEKTDIYEPYFTASE